MNQGSLVSIDDISKEQILDLLDRAAYFEAHPNLSLIHI